MTAQSTKALVPAAADAAACSPAISDEPTTAAREPSHGAEIFVPLHLLKASPKNARKARHSQANLEALAASIKAKGVLQSPVVEIERSEDGAPTGRYLVTIGEGRRLALRMLVKRKAIKRTHPVRVTVDTENDAHEISLDENVTREAMHPADQFEAFQRLADERGYGPEDIAARFGVSPQIVRQRLRLGTVAPELMASYRMGALSLDQLTAFCVSSDHDRQRQVFDQCGPNTPPYAIRRAMTETKVAAIDRRARFVALETYLAEGGTVTRDLFTEDGGGWLDDPALLDRLVADKLTSLAEDVREREGWKWAVAAADYGEVSALGRVYPVQTERSEADAERIASLSEEYDRLAYGAEVGGSLSPETDARLEAIDAALQAYGPDFDYSAEMKARAGVMVVLGYDGLARFERGLVRAEDAREPSRIDLGGADDPSRCGGEEAGGPAVSEPVADECLAPLSDRLVIDLTAHKTMGLRDAVQAHPDIALRTVVHALALQVFYPPWGVWTPLQLRLTLAGLERLAPGVSDAPAGRRIADRTDGWGTRLPEAPEELWSTVSAMTLAELLDLLACCVGLGLYAVRDPHDRKPDALAQADVLATATGLDMTGTWTATSASYFSRVSKARVLEAVTEATTPEEATRIAGFKKTDMADAAERLVAETGWIPPVLRTTDAHAVRPQAEVSQTPTQAQHERYLAAE